MNEDLIRQRFMISERNGSEIMLQKCKAINFCSNDYLGLAKHPAIIKAFIDSAQQYGLGASASPIVSGYFRTHQKLEEAFADYLQKERALLFSSGFLANISLFHALTNENEMIASDRLCHASILDGIKLAKAKHRRFPHQAIDLIPTNANWIVTESIFSMEGDITPLAEIKQLGVKTIVDTAHSAGIYKVTGADIVVTPLGKTFASLGAIVAGSHDDIETILQKARGYHYATALPPAVAAATLAALNVIKIESERIQILFSLIQFFLNKAAQLNIPLVSNDLTPIKTILIGDNRKTMQLKEQLLTKGFFVAGIRPPTVPRNSARLRITITFHHTEQDILGLLEGLREIL